MNQEKLGSPPFTDRQSVNDFKEEVDAKSDPDLGQASLDVRKASGRIAGEHHVQEGDLQKNIKEGKEDTEGF